MTGYRPSALRVPSARLGPVPGPSKPRPGPRPTPTCVIAYTVPLTVIGFEGD
jgi:hypothetical protein